MSRELSDFEKIGGTYTEVDGIFYPNIIVEKEEPLIIGKYGLLWLGYMEENHNDRYRHLMRMGCLQRKAYAVNEEAYEMLEQIMNKYLAKHKPVNSNRDMAVLQAAADEWKDKWDHWYQYCYEQHYAYVNPVLVIQVQNATSSAISATNLDDCVAKIEERTGIQFQEGEVIHTFGDANTVIKINGLNVPYVAPSAIAEDKRIRMVFFKESLSTGWDCPRAETMMSFRHATDATYIAQLLGRMIRTPMQMHIQVDETLNDVHLYLPYFNSDTVKEVVEELQNAEGGDIPADIYGESLDARVMDTLSVRPRSTSSGGGARHTSVYPGQMSLFDISGTVQPMEVNDGEAVPYSSGGQTGNGFGVREISTSSGNGTEQNTATNPSVGDQVQQTQSTNNSTMASSSGTAPSHTNNMPRSEPKYVPETFTDPLDREGVVKAINDSGLLSYDVRNVRISNYLNSLYSLARLLRQSGKYQDATDDVLEEIVKMIREYVGDLKRNGKYDDLTKKVMEFQMKSQVFDVFGESVDDSIVHMFMSTTDIDIDRQFRRAETKLGNEGVGNKYGHYYYDEDDPNAYKIDVILYASNDDCYERLLSYAEKAFHKMNDNYRRKIVGLGERFIKQYDARRI